MEEETTPAAPPTKRVMTSSIPWLSVGQERQCLNEIRRVGLGVSSSYKLRNGMSAGEFALNYVVGHHLKRQAKNVSKRGRSRACSEDSSPFDNAAQSQGVDAT